MLKVIIRNINLVIKYILLIALPFILNLYGMLREMYMFMFIYFIAEYVFLLYTQIIKRIGKITNSFVTIKITFRW